MLSMLRRTTMASVSLFTTSHPLQSPRDLKHFLCFVPVAALHLRSWNRKRLFTTAKPLFISPAVPQASTSTIVDLNPYYLSCSIPVKRLKVAVLLSGGVDSSVALRLLHAAGHSCTAFYLKIWFQEDFENFWSECPWEEDLKYAKSVCDQVDVPLEVVHLTDEYWKNVVSHIIAEYRCGRTPNPDVLCNTRIKFGAFMDAISGMEFDYVASGHYAKVVHTTTGQVNELSFLELSEDMLHVSGQGSNVLPFTSFTGST